jgi:choline dehydrogenase-like flavoprotein
MIGDLDQIPDRQTFPCDVCIVGSGAAGIALATELLGSGLRTILVEGGGADVEPASQELYDAAIDAHAFPGATDGRFRTFGGSTTRWGGGSQPLDPIDFEPRDWVPQSGWPIPYDELAPYWRRGAAFLRTDSLNWDNDLLPLLGVSAPAFAPGGVGYNFYKSAPQPDLRRVYGRRLRDAAPDDLTVLLHANLTRIDTQGDRVAKVEVRSLDGRSATIVPGRLVICAGAIETVRILLANGNLGNAHDQLGRHFQDHPVARVGTIRSDDPDRLQDLFNTFYRRGHKYAVRLPASAEFQRRERILNASAVVKFETPPDSPYIELKEAVLAAKRLAPGGIGRLVKAAGRAVWATPQILRPVYAYAVRGRGYTPDPQFTLAVTTEQEPGTPSRITLADERDALGTPKAKIHWQLGEVTRRTMAVYARVVADEFGRLDLGQVELEPWLTSDKWRSSVGDQYHHLGGARMHADPARGVVDTLCRVHNVENLYLASSAVFPTGGQAGPTLTIIALAIRLADHLRATL